MLDYNIIHNLMSSLIINMEKSIFRENFSSSYACERDMITNQTRYIHESRSALLGNLSIRDMEGVGFRI